MSRSAPLACHIQIAKTGTNTVRSLIKDSCPIDRFLSFKVPDREIDGDVVTVETKRDDIVQFLETAVKRQWDVDLITVMLPIGLHALLQREVEYFTFVREPVARCISGINFVFNRRDTHPDARVYSEVDWSIPRIVQAGGAFFSNDQVRILAGSAKKQVGEEELELAKKNINALFFMVGVTAKFATCWDFIADHYGLKRDVTCRNASDYTKGVPLSEADYDAVRNANLLDAALYAWVLDEYLPKRLEALRRTKRPLNSSAPAPLGVIQQSGGTE